MKILMIASIFPPEIGGPSRQIWDLTNALAKNKNYKIIVLTFAPKRGIKEVNNFKIYRVALRPHYQGIVGALVRQFDILWHLIWIIKQEKIDLIHCHDVMVLGLASGLVARIFCIPSVIKYPGDLVYETVNKQKLVVKDIHQVFSYNFWTRFLRLFEQYILGLHTQIWAVSRFQKHILRDCLSIPLRKIILMPNFIDLTFYKQEPRKVIGKKIRVLVASRFTPWKQVEEINSIAKFLTRYDIEFVVVGGGSKKAVHRIQRIVKHSQAKLRFIGKRSPTKVYKEFLKANLYLSLACYEPFSIALIEAHAAGLPSIAPNSTGIPEILVNGKTGLLYPEGDWKKAAINIKRLVTNQKQYQKMCCNAFRVGQKYNIEQNLSFIQEFYRQVSNYETL